LGTSAFQAAQAQLTIGELVERRRVAGKPAEWLGRFARAQAWGGISILTKPLLALFCSTACPGQVLLRAMDRARELRDAGRTVMGGFHSPLERECLTVLLRGAQPVVICPARGLGGMRVPAEWRAPLGEGRLLVLSPFGAQQRRVTAALAAERNQFVLALADEVWFAHVAPGGETERLARLAGEWGKDQGPR
jgi:hypothetical protein